MSTCSTFYFFLRSNNKHCPHQRRCGNSLKLRFGSGEHRFPEFGFLGRAARCPIPETSGGRWTLPTHPASRTCRGWAASAPCRPPHARGPDSTPAPRARAAPTLRSPCRGRAACGQGRGRAGANRGGAGPGPSAWARPPIPRRGLAGASPTYAVFLLLRGGPHGRAGRGPAGAAAGQQRGGDGRGPGCGAPRAEAGAVRRRGAVGGASLTGRPGCRRHLRTARLRGRPSGPGRRGRGLATCSSPPLPQRRSVPHSSDARLAAPPRFGSPQRARRTPAHAPLPGARGLALPGLAPPEPAREPTRRRRRALAEGNPREAIGWPGRGQR